jgi:hypothetical protein
MAKAHAPPLLGELMRAGRFVALTMPAVAGASRSSARWGGSLRASASGSAPLSSAPRSSGSGGSDAVDA